MKHILTARQFKTDELAELFALANSMREALKDPAGRRKLAEKHKGLVLATLFYEPSTRTRLSFEAAATRLGIGVVSTENAKEFSSAIKGETIEDSTRVIAGYADAVVMRHFESGAAERAAAVSNVPVVNAGDGAGEHPTQALLDLYTIQHEKSRLENLHVVIGGDLKHGRTARSLAQMLSIYPGNTITFVSTPELKIGDDIRAYLTERKVSFTETDDLVAAVKPADVVYWTRLQKERLDNPALASGFVIDASVLQAMKPDAVIMHPLPRVDEISASVDTDPRAAYFRQAENGLYVRMALLDTILRSQE